jgi:glycosyltransferase involved in cell wall biosynthesis
MYSLEIIRELFVISVIVCTWNRAKALSICLDALEHQTLDFNSFDVVVVNNNSTDETCEMLERFSSATKLNFNSYLEKHQGISASRNRGVLESKGEFLVFLDDDSVAAPELLANINSLFTEANVDAIAGKVICVIPDNLDSDIPKAYLAKLSFSSIDFGECMRPMLPHEYAVGANMSFRRSLLDNLGSFKEYLGYKGDRKIIGEDDDIWDRAMASGALCVWAPSAVVYHHPSADRFTKAKLRKSAYYYGAGRFLHKYGLTPGILIRTVYVIKYCFKVILKMIEFMIMAYNPSKRFKTELKVRIYLGKLAAALAIDR